MSMKSMTMIPPRSRSRSCRTISSAASRLFFVTVSSRLPPLPVNFPVLTSTTIIASVRSMTRYPPEGNQTLRSSAFASCSSTPRGEVGCDPAQVVVDGLPFVGALDDDLGEVFVEDVADDADDDVGLAVDQ